MICTLNFVCKLKSSFSNILRKKCHVVYDFIYVKTIFAYIFIQNDNISIFKGLLFTSWRGLTLMIGTYSGVNEKKMSIPIHW